MGVNETALLLPKQCIDFVFFINLTRLERFTGFQCFVPENIESLGLHFQRSVRAGSQWLWHIVRCQLLKSHSSM